MHGSALPGLRRGAPMLLLALLTALVVMIEDVSAEAACAQPPGAVVSAVNDDASAIVLSWDAPAGCAPDSYAVYRRTIGEAGSRMAHYAVVDGAELSYTDEQVSAGATYRYRVRSNDLGPRSGWTQTVMTEPAPEPEPEPEPGERTDRAVLRAEVTLLDSWGDRTPDTGLAVGRSTLTDDRIQAQKFTTGSHPDGYIVTSVTFRVPSVHTLGGLSAQVSIYTADAGGNPETSKYVLTGDITTADSPGTVTFTAPAGATLDAGTDYFVYFEETDTSTDLRSYGVGIEATKIFEGEPGWSLGDSQVQHNDAAWAVTPQSFVSLIIKGEPADTTAPALSTATADGASLVLTYNEPLDAGSVPDAPAYLVKVGDYPSANASSVAVSGSQVTLTLEHLVVHGHTVTLSYTPPSTTPVQDAAGNDAAALSGQAVTNNAPAPLLSGWPSATPFQSLGVGDLRMGSTRVQAQKFRTGPNAQGYILSAVSFYVAIVSAANVTEQVSIYTAGADGNPGSSKYVLSGGFSDIGHTTFTAPANAVLDPNTDYFVYFEDTLHNTAYGSYAIGIPSDKASDGLAGWSFREIHYTLNAGPWQEDNSAIIVVHLTGEVIDTIAPALRTATVDGTSLVLTYDEPLDEDVAPAVSAYAVTVGSNTAAPPSAVAVAGSAVTLTLATGAAAGDTVTLGYTRPPADPLQDLAGNDAAALSGRAVANYTGRSNAAPTFDDGATTTRSVNENVGAGVDVGDAVVASDADSGATLGYSLSGSSLFAIDPVSGRIGTVSANTLDHEDTASHAVTVGVSDGLDEKGNADAELDNTITVTIEINNLDEPGRVTYSPGGVLRGGVTITASLTDPDGATSNVAWQWQRAATLGGSYDDISGATAAAYQVVAADVGTFLRVVVEYDDPHGSGKETTLALLQAVVAGNAEPAFSVEAATYSVDENVAVGGHPDEGLPKATDGDGDVLTYVLTGADSASFNLQVLNAIIFITTATALDYETKDTYSLSWTVKDGKDAAGFPDDSADDSVAITVSVNNVDEMGTATLSGTQEGGSTLTATLTDPDGMTSNHAWSWSRSAMRLGTTTAISGATSNTYRLVAADVDQWLNLVVRYTDPHGPDKTLIALSGQIAGVNVAPEFDEAGLVSREVPENSAVGTEVGTALTASDVDGDTLTYLLGGMDASSFSIDSETGQITTEGSDLDYENRPLYGVTVYVHDGKDAAGDNSTVPDDVKFLSISVTNVNEAPVITPISPTATVSENTPALSTVKAFAATDVDAGTTLSWDVESADDGDLFEIDSNGELTFKASPDFEDPQDADADNAYVLTVKVTDDGIPGMSTPALSDTLTITVTVTNVNEAPRITTTNQDSPSFDENGTGIVATYAAEDVDAGSNLTWSLDGNDRTNFTITKNGDGEGEVRFTNPPNFEAPEDADTMNDYDIRVKVVDNHSPQLEDARDVTVSVEDVNEAPVFTGGAASISVRESPYDTQTDWSVRWTYQAVDDDRDTLAWTVGGEDAQHFGITAEGAATLGSLSFHSPPDFEVPLDVLSDNTYRVTVYADDQQGESNSIVSRDVVITVTNRDENPYFTGGSEAPTFAEIEWDAASADLVVETYSAADYEDETITWSISQYESGFFRIDASTGVLSFRDPPDFESAQNLNHPQGYRLNVQATDSSTPIPNTSPNRANSSSLIVTVTVTNVDETPEIISQFSAIDYDEIEYDSGLSAADIDVVRFFTARDEEGQDITWSLGGDDADDFTITENADGDGVVAFSILPDHEAPMGSDGDDPNTYQIIVQASDTASPTNTATRNFSVSVLDVNERPELTGTITESVRYDENATIAVADYTARDEEGAVTWSLTGADAGDFAIDSGGTVTFNATPNYEDPAGSQSDADQDIADNVYAFTVVATDIESDAPRRTARVDVVVTVDDVEEEGVIAVSNLNPGVGGTIEFTLSDPDGGIVFALTDADPPGFNWVTQTRITDGAWVEEHRGNNLEDFTFYYPDEDDTGREVRVIIEGYSDRRGVGKTVQSEATAPVTADPITNAPPRFRSGFAQNIPETGAGEDVGDRVTASDRENDTLTFGIEGGSGADFVEIDPVSGQLRTIDALDYETAPPHLLVTFTVHDGKDVDGNAETPPTVDTSYTAVIRVLDVEEDGVVGLSPEDPEVGDTVQATLTDGDGAISGEGWQWARSLDGRGGWSNIRDATSAGYNVTQSDADFHLRARVTYTDNRGAGKSAEGVTRKAFGENQRPTFPSTEDGARTVAENSRTGVNIGAPVAAEDPESDRLTYSLSGPGAAAFTITASSGQLRTKEALDFEGEASYSVTVDVHDGRDGLGNESTATDDSQAVTITVENVEEPGTVTLSTPTGTVQARVDVTASLSDDDGPIDIGWRWSRSPNGRTSWVNIAGANGAVYRPTLLADVGNYIRATAEYTDALGPGKSAEAVSARVGAPPPVNSAPVFQAAEDGRREAPENTGAGDAVGVPVEATDANASDPMVNDPLVYSLIGPDAASFTIDSGSGQLRLAPDVTLDYEGKRTHRLTVQVTDGRDQNGDDDDDAIDDTINVVISVTDVNEPPEVTGDEAPSIQENASSAVATYTAADPERDTIIWSVSDPDTFWISSRGELFFRTPPSYEDNGSYTVTVQASDGKNDAGAADTDIDDTIMVTVSVTDEEEPGIITITPPRGWEGTLFEATLQDDDGEIRGRVWQWSRSTDRSSWIEIGDTNSDRYTALDVDVGHYLRVTAIYEDRRGSNKSAEVRLAGRIPAEANPETNLPPEFAEEALALEIGQGTAPGRPIGQPVRATDPDAGDILTYSLTADVDAADFAIDAATGQLRTRSVLDPEVQGIHEVMVSVHDGFGATYQVLSTEEDDRIQVTITVRAVNVRRTTGGGGGGGGGGGSADPTPSDVDFEWNVARDIEELDAGHESASGAWSDGETLWVLENGDGADDGVYAYDLKTGERVEEREFDLDERNRAPRGIWSDGATVWVSDSGQDKLFAHDLATGERLPGSDIALAERNRDPRGIWSDGETLWVLDGGKDALFAYDLASGEQLAEYSLDSASGDPHGLWSDGVSIWVSDDGPKRLFAYRLPVPVQEGEEQLALERVRDEEFTELPKAGNNSPRGIWSDGDVMYVADSTDDRVYSYNMPDAIDARLAALTLSGVDIGGFESRTTEYTGAPGEDVTETTVAATPEQDAAEVSIEPADADAEAEGHQLGLEGLGEITITVASPDGSRTKVYRVQIAAGQQAGPTCLSGAVSVGFSLLTYEGGGIGDLDACARGRHVAALYVLADGEYVSYIIGAPEFVNARFVGLFADGVPPGTPLVARSDGPASADPAAGGPGAGDAGVPWPECLRGEVVEGFSLVIYEGGSVDELASCVQSRNVTAVYALAEGEWVPYILRAPDFVNLPFRALYPDGLPPMTALVIKSDEPQDGEEN